MNIMTRFMAYAGDFEKTLADDDWARLHGYFADDAVYHVDADVFGCRLVGRAAILAGMKKSLDGFDRKFDGRDIEVVDGPEIAPDEIRMGWQVIYRKEGLPTFTLRGRSTIRYIDGKIVHLTDSYDPSVNSELTEWQRQTGLRLNPAYT